MTKNQPRLSIGLPVYNGEKFLKEAIESLLAQTFADFELIICDNASTDKTEEICRTYATKDKRIRYYRNERNIGCAPNFNRVFELSTGEYFKWAAYDDLHAPDFIARCIEILDKDPSIILCHSQAYLIDENSDILRTYDIKLKTDSPKPQERFHELLTKHLSYQCYGVIRASALRITPPMGSYGLADGIFLLRLGILGKFYEIGDRLFFARIHPQQSMSMFFPDYLSFTNNNTQYSSSMIPDFYGWSVWLDSANEGQIIFPHWRILWEYTLSVWLFPMNLYQRICCHVSLYKKLRGNESFLIKDLTKAAQMFWIRWRNYSSQKQQIKTFN
ncbi:glycosyltransferase [Hassallia byssoidea VB512170]|uniref:Glycosyltransferase n=1 Tax=Hassallia byssoidea VB512170 TaxID=1304833 RepID=A0A846H5H1_9CYAN|nr:glycosyltransferase [Hassalia byssoidea]NEU72877.1 glycosyltransferase [Hassalia byssoidea VB512170]